MSLMKGMVAMNHSPEPWKINYETGITSAIDAVGEPVDMDAPEGSEHDNWIRIVACVNFCKGMTQEQMERRSCKADYDLR